MIVPRPRPARTPEQRDRIRFVRERLAREIAGAGDPGTIRRLTALLNQLLNGTRKVDGKTRAG